VVQKLIRERTEKPNYIDVLALWDDDCMETRMDNPTHERLKKKEYNEKHYHDAWKANLGHIWDVEMIK
jgi:hypothetical protein